MFSSLRFGTILVRITTRTCTHGVISQTWRIFMTQKRYQVARRRARRVRQSRAEASAETCSCLWGWIRDEHGTRQTAGQTSHGHYTSVRSTAIYYDETGRSHPAGVNRTAHRQTLFSPRPFVVVFSARPFHRSCKSHLLHT